jgi:hypothetical protein
MRVATAVSPTVSLVEHPANIVAAMHKAMAAVMIFVFFIFFSPFFFFFSYYL